MGRKEREQSWFPISSSVVAAAREKSQTGRAIEAVQANQTSVQRAISAELTESNISPLTSNVSIESGTLYARMLAALAWLWFIVALPFITDAAGDLFMTIMLGFTWMALALFWLCGLFAMPFISRSSLVRLIFKTYFGVTQDEIVLFHPRSSSAQLWWASAGLAVLVGLLLAFSDAGLILRVALSERALNAYVAAVPPGTQNLSHPNRLVGLFFVDGARESNGVVALYTYHRGVFPDLQGIVFVPDGATAPGHFRDLRHLHGKWYRFEERN
jgi:hypothetical protein